MQKGKGVELIHKKKFDVKLTTAKKRGGAQLDFDKDVVLKVPSSKKHRKQQQESKFPMPTKLSAALPLRGAPAPQQQGAKNNETSEDNRLPIFAYKEAIVDSVRKYKTTIVVGETGSGKSTQLAQFLYDARNKEAKEKYTIVCTQPRRVAAITIAQRVAYERSTRVGEEIGYSVRFDDSSSQHTRIKYVTDGVLLREAMSDNMLSKYSVVILDESHERSLQTDILMGLLKQIQSRRPALRIVVMSATLDVQLFMNFFEDSHFLRIPGRQFPVDMYYTKEPEAEFLEAAMITVLQIHAEEEEGGILVFLPGQEDIEGLVQLLRENLPAITASKLPRVNNDDNSFQDFRIFPLYSALSQEDQLRAFKASPPGIRKIVVATNIAETSLTIAGIKYVVDTGFHKSRSLVAATGMESLKVAPVSKSQANQRSGRAGRESPGKCFRLYTEETFEALDESTVPEIRRMNITQVVLQLHVLGIDSPETFPFPSPPHPDSILRATSHLCALGALDKHKKLTEHGRKMSKLPLEPNLAHMLLRSAEFGCTFEAIAAVAMLSAENVFVQPHDEKDKQLATISHKNFATKTGDLTSQVNIYFNWLKAKRDPNWTRQRFFNQRSLLHAADICKQLSDLLSAMQIDPTVSCQPDTAPFQKCIAAGLFLNVAKKNISATFTNGQKKGSQLGRGNEAPAPYKTMYGSTPVHIHPSSVMFSLPGGEKKLPEYVTYAEILTTSKHYMRCITSVDESALIEVAPQFYKKP